MDDIKNKRRPQVKVPHNLRFNAGEVKRELGLTDKAWSGFIEQVRKMAGYPLKDDAASFFVEDLLLPKDSKSLSNKAQREHNQLIAGGRREGGTRHESFIPRSCLSRGWPTARGAPAIF